MLDKNLMFGGAFFMSKFSTEEKLEAVLRVVNDGMSYRNSARILGCATRNVEKWVYRYRQFGFEGLLMKQGSYTGDFKLSVIQYMHEHHLSLSQAAVHFGIPAESTLNKWERIYYEEGPQGLYKDNRGRKSKMKNEKPKAKKLDKKTEEDLIAEVQRLRMENEYLKKLNALVQERIARENGNE